MSKDQKQRCGWATNVSPLYTAYHDHEWGVPLHDEHALFEFLVLEGAQAGLSWSTILNKRENYRAAYEGFDPEKVVRFDQKKVANLLSNPGIVRNRAKVGASIINAQKFLDVQNEFGSFDHYIWGFVDNCPIQNEWKSLSEVPTETTESNALSRDLKKRGFKFVGSTICYALMQAIGMVNDHTTDCFRYREVRTKN